MSFTASPNDRIRLPAAQLMKSPGAKLYIRTPHYSGIYAWKDPTHVRSFTSESFGYFGENSYSYSTHARFRVESLRLNYPMEPSPRRIHRWGGAMVQRMLDRHPTFSERFLAHLVGGIDEIQVTLEAVKDHRDQAKTG
jgi:hypothetical protein